MGIISKDKREITLYYHSGTFIGKQTLAYVKASKKKLRAVGIAKNQDYRNPMDGVGPRFRQDYLGFGGQRTSEFC